jgi:hypothetical protein
MHATLKMLDLLRLRIYFVGGSLDVPRSLTVMIACFSVAALALCYARTPSRPRDAWIGPIGAAACAAGLLICVGVLSYGSGGILGQSFFEPALMVFGVPVFAGAGVGLAVRRLGRRRLAALCLWALTVAAVNGAIPSSTIPVNTDSLTAASQFARHWDAVNADILAKRQRGERDIVEPTVQAYWGNPGWSADPSNSLNRSVARYYGIDSLRSQSVP